MFAFNLLCLEPAKLFWVPSISPSSLLIYSGNMFPQWKGSGFIGALWANRDQYAVEPLHHVERVLPNIVDVRQALRDSAHRVHFGDDQAQQAKRVEDAGLQLLQVQTVHTLPEMREQPPELGLGIPHQVLEENDVNLTRMRLPQRHEGLDAPEEKQTMA